MEDETGEPGSLEYIRCRDLYPKKALTLDEESLCTPYAPLPGEGVEFLGRTSDGIIALSSFRLFIRSSNNLIINVPLAHIDSIECRDIFFLFIYCKDAKSYR